MRSLNSRDVKAILKVLNSQYGYDGKLDYFVFEDNDKLFVVSKEYNNLNLEGLRVRSVGVCLGEYKGEDIVLTIEGSQLIGKDCSSVVDTDDVRDWLRGEDISYDGDLEGIVIVRNSKDHIGCGNVRDSKIINLVDKSRRLKSKD